MVDKAEIKAESLLNLDELLQCPVCYEIPSGQIYQCNEGHHVCTRCKTRLDVCPVCRAFFFGTRNYAMEELIANFRKLRPFKKDQNASGSSESSAPAKESTPGECENDINEGEEDTNVNVVNVRPQRPPQACKGLFRCLCCKIGKVERLPAARLLNHLRYFHAPDLLEGRSENGEYLQAWQFTTTPGKIVTAVRIADMGVFFLTIEFEYDSVYAWLTMAASPWVAHVYNYTITISGNDREAIFSDCVSSVRSCEGSLKKRGHCLVVKDTDALALLAPAIISGKLSVRRTPRHQLATQTQPRAVLRIANRGNNNTSSMPPSSHIQGMDDVERFYIAFANIDRETLEMHSEVVHEERESDARISEPAVEEAQPPAQQEIVVPYMSRNARRRMRRAQAMQPTASPTSNSSASSPASPMPNTQNSGTSAQLPSTIQGPQAQMENVVDRNPQRPSVSASTTLSRLSNDVSAPTSGPAPTQTSRQNGCVYARPLAEFYSEPTSAHVSVDPLLPSPSATGPSQPERLTENGSRNKKKRRHRR